MDVLSSTGGKDLENGLYNRGCDARKAPPQTRVGERLQDIRKAPSLTQVRLAEAAETAQRAGSYDETGAGSSPAPALISLPKALNVTTDESLGLKSPSVIRLSNALVAAGPVRKNVGQGERYGR
ncbi:MAG: helix-turn-helix transcriptional regulator [Acidobacteria bacterium]|nr:helix-turn-helix transcriptional regulator [Acidobacteriota bacterium]MBI3470690.1 helix-turn-helix transcriptional regulator [Candidatus Solibacter usitatus]